MTETVRNTQSSTGKCALGIWTANDNRQAALVLGRSPFPKDAVAHIYTPSRSVVTSGKAGMNGWRLVFERRTPPFIEPLMGWTGGDDTLAQVELEFRTREAAVRYAERQGLRYTVDPAGGGGNREPPMTEPARALFDTTFHRAGGKHLAESCQPVREAAANRNEPQRRLEHEVAASRVPLPTREVA